MLSRGSSLCQSVSQEALALPLAGTGELIVVPDAVTASSPLYAQTMAETSGWTDVPLGNRESDSQPRYNRLFPARHHELRNNTILVASFCVLLIATFTMCMYQRQVRRTSEAADLLQTLSWLCPRSTTYPSLYMSSSSA